MNAIMIKIASRKKRKDNAVMAASRKAGRTGWGDEPKGPSLGRAAASAQPPARRAASPVASPAASPVHSNVAKSSTGPSKSGMGANLLKGSLAAAGVIGTGLAINKIRKNRAARAAAEQEDAA